MNIKGSKDLHEKRFQVRVRDVHGDLIESTARCLDMPPAVLARQLILEGMKHHPMFQNITRPEHVM